jgi:hypothetical protein
MNKAEVRAACKQPPGRLHTPDIAGGTYLALPEVPGRNLPITGRNASSTLDLPARAQNRKRTFS